MKTPIIRPVGGIWVGFLLVAVALVQLVLAGFMSMPSDHVAPASSDDAMVDIEALIKRVIDLNRQNKHQEAVELLLASLENQPEGGMVRALLVQTFDLFLEQEVRQGQIDIEKNPRDMTAYSRLAGSLELLGDSFRAMEMLLNGIRENQKSSNLWMKIARLELKAHRDTEALDVFREVIRIDKKNSDAYNNAAYILAHLSNNDPQDLKEALTFAEKAHKLDPKNAEYLDTLAEVQFRKGNHKEALSLIEQAIKLAPLEDALKNQLARFRSGSPLIAE